MRARLCVCQNKGEYERESERERDRERERERRGREGGAIHVLLIHSIFVVALGELIVWDSS